MNGLSEQEFLDFANKKLNEVVYVENAVGVVLGDIDCELKKEGKKGVKKESQDVAIQVLESLSPSEQDYFIQESEQRKKNRKIVLKKKYQAIEKAEKKAFALMKMRNPPTESNLPDDQWDLKIKKRKLNGGLMILPYI